VADGKLKSRHHLEAAIARGLEAADHDTIGIMPRSLLVSYIADFVEQALVSDAALCPSRRGSAEAGYRCALPAGHTGDHATEGQLTTWKGKP